MLAAGSPTHFPRMFSYGPANLRARRTNDLSLQACLLTSKISFMNEFGGEASNSLALVWVKDSQKCDVVGRQLLGRKLMLESGSPERFRSPSEQNSTS
jgi:hypothetical protein